MLIHFSSLPIIAESSETGKQNRKILPSYPKPGNRQNFRQLGFLKAPDFHNRTSTKYKSS
ncbi:MAG: hypothetical protein WBF52_15640 [Geitlerinemataceae cyanobacterium]